MRICLLLLMGLTFAACVPKELPAPKHQQGEAIIGSVTMGELYDYQVFFSLKNNKVISRNHKADWDLAFESNHNGYHVILNESKFMFAYNTENSNFQSVTDTTGFEQGKSIDSSNGNMASTAIGDWRSNKPVYIIDRGSNKSGQIRFTKLQINAVDNSGYKITFQALPNGNIRTMHIPKDNHYNFTYLSLNDNGKLVKIAPPKTDWDLCFTQYTVQIPIPYLVTGVLLNPYQTKAIMDSTISFPKIDLAYAQQKELSNTWDAIGYNWKEYDFNNASYQVFPELNYIIRSQYKTYYKLHFIAFYDNNGIKGNPRFEFNKL